MTRVQWHASGKSRFQTGVDRGMLYVRDNTGAYGDGVAWNGLTAVNETPSGAEPNKVYADNKVYLILKSNEEFAATIEALMSPPEFDVCDGAASPAPGLYFGQQTRSSFAFSYRGLIGNELEGTDLGYRVHIVYGCDAAPAEKSNATVNETPEAAGLSWEVATNPIVVGEINSVEYRPVAHVWYDSTEADPTALAALEAILYGDDENEPRLPLPAEVAAIMGEDVTAVNLALGDNQPTYDDTTHVVTLPAVTGVQWKINGVNKAAGAQPALTVGQTANIVATPQEGYTLNGDDDWVYTY